MALVVTITQQKDDNAISLQVLPVGDETYLPVGLMLTVIAESGETFIEISSGSTDNLFQTRQFGGRAGERFRVQISLDEERITEDFVI
jgi:hypothetical protein